MSSDSKDEDQAETGVSCFALDGVVAEMVIEVEDNAQNSTKLTKGELKSSTGQLKEDSENKSSPRKNSPDTRKSNEDSENKSIPNSCDDDHSEKEQSETDEVKGTKDLEKIPANLENKETLMESKGSQKRKSDDDSEENKDEEDTKKKENLKVNSENNESSIETPKQQKKLRGRPMKKINLNPADLKKEKMKLKADSNENSEDEAESSKLKTRAAAKSNNPSMNISLKRGNKTKDASEEEAEIPEKKLRSSASVNSTKKAKGSVSFSPVARESDLTKRQSLRKTTLLKATSTPNKSTPSTSKATPVSSKATPVSSKTTPTSNKGKVAPSRVQSSTNVKVATLKAWDLDPGKIYSLDNFPEIKKQVKQAEVKFLKCLHRTLFNKVLPKDVLAKDLRKEILKFQGYNFKKSSDAYEKHQNILKKLPDSSIDEIAKILAIKKRSIFNIMKFLLKPSKVIYCEVDPFHPSMQPVLQLPKITLGSSSTDDSSNNQTFSGEDTLTSSKRKRFPSTKLRFYHSDFNLPATKKKTLETVKPGVASTTSKTVVKKEFPSTVAKKSAISLKAQSLKRTKQAVVKKIKHKARIGIIKRTKKSYGPSLPRQLGVVKEPISSDIQVRRRALELAIEIQETVGPSEFEEDDESALPSFEYEPDVKEEVVTDDETENQEKSTSESVADQGDVSKEGEQDIETRSENASSDVTLSADETKEITSDEVPQKKRFYKPHLNPLKSYPLIKENILRADYSALQRLHIVLFGASDKASNLRGNILSFGGFPFYHGSEEWKQKEFLLSLLSQSTLKEYCDILGLTYRDGNLRLLIKKLMKFLTAPIEKLPDDDNEDDDDLEMEVISLEKTVPISPIVPNEPKKASNIKLEKKKATPIKVEKKKVVRKPPAEKKPPRYRKVLMDEAQVRRLEADLAREQRILEREKKLHDEQTRRLRLSSLNKQKPADMVIKQPVSENQTETELLNALMETVYQRRELKKAGANVSIPDKGGHTRLGELANVKFLVVTANYNDLDVLHHLIYMTEANKSRVRKNILDFAGFNFTEESPAYKDRMTFLASLGYDISRRIAFLLGLCPYKTLIAQQDLNELIMYFLMSPCQSKQVPIRHLPTTFFGKDMPVELSALVQKHSGDLTVSPVKESTSNLSSREKDNLQITVTGNQHTPSSKESTSRPRAKKSFKSVFPSSKMRGLTPSISTLPLKTPQKVTKPSVALQKPMQPTPTLSVPHVLLEKGILKTQLSQGTAPKEFYIQQKTIDGQQKTFKLIKLPTNHPLSNVMKTQVSQPLPTVTSEIQPQPITITPPVIGAPGLPPGLIVFKNNPTNPALSSVMQTVPLAIGQSTTKIINHMVVPSTPGMKPFLLPRLIDNCPMVISNPTEKPTEEKLPDEKNLTVPVECNYSTDEEVEELCPLEDSNPPTEEELYGSIQDIIHNCPSLEDITLRNVINQVSAKYPAFDLTPQHYFMKECVKKIIMGT